MKLYLFLIIFLSSCGLFRSEDTKRSRVFAKYKEVQKNDYVEHLAALGKDYINSPNVKLLKIDQKAHDYLESLYENITQNNELLLNKKYKPSFYIVKNATPFFFSLPESQFFFSSGLITKYFKNEQTLVSVLAHEIIRSVNTIYEKNIIVPIGYLRTERILALTRISTQTKVEVYKWTFFAVKRAGHDPLAILHWIQIQNKNTLDFTLQHGDSRNISREEFQFKNFVVTQGLDKEHLKIRARNSSKEFYYLINFIKRST